MNDFDFSYIIKLVIGIVVVLSFAISFGFTWWKESERKIYQKILIIFVALLSIVFIDISFKILGIGMLLGGGYYFWQNSQMKKYQKILIIFVSFLFIALLIYSSRSKNKECYEFCGSETLDWTDEERNQCFAECMGDY